MRVKALVSAAIAACMLAVAGIAWAKGWVTTVTIHETKTMSVRGRVYSNNPPCRYGRTIQVIHKTGQSGQVVGTTTSFKSDSKPYGVWKLGTPLHPGYYYAHATKRNNCLGGNSKVIFVH